MPHRKKTTRAPKRREPVNPNQSKASHPPPKKTKNNEKKHSPKEQPNKKSLIFIGSKTFDLVDSEDFEFSQLSLNATFQANMEVQQNHAHPTRKEKKIKGGTPSQNRTHFSPPHLFFCHAPWLPQNIKHKATLSVFQSIQAYFDVISNVGGKDQRLRK